jgi:flagellar hook-associated protein 1 FlgK
MNLDAALRIAAGGIANIDRQLAIVSQNVANAETPDYARQTGAQRSLTADGMALGVVSDAATRRVDTAIQAALFSQDGAVAELRARASALEAIDAAHGVPGQGDDLPARLGALRDAFSALLGQPDAQAGQGRVVAAADALARQINGLANAYGAQRQNAHDAIGVDLRALAAGLEVIGALNARIVALKAGGGAIGDLENQRDAALHDVAGLISVKTLVRESGEMLVVTEGGLALPTRDPAAALGVLDANLRPGFYHPGGGVPGVTLRGQDVTSQLTGGRIGAHLALRDRILPGFQAELDGFAQGVAARLAGQGLRLFSDPQGSVPATGGVPAQAGFVGFSLVIQVDDAVRAQPALTRDGTDAVTGSPTGASAFTPNPTGGPAGFTTLIRRVLDFAFGDQAQAGVPHEDFAMTGLGPAGTLATGYAPPPTLADYATTLVAAQAERSAAVTDRLETETVLRDRLAERNRAISGVSLDAEMALMLTLQTAYAATARVLSVTQSVLDDLMRLAR